MGFTDLKMIVNKKDSDICSDKELLKLYAEYDEYVYSTGKPVSFRENIKPKMSSRTLKLMEGVFIPLYFNRIMPEAIAILIRPQNQLLALGMDQLCILPFSTLQSVLTRRKYSIQLPIFNKSLARMEILCFSQLLKGKHAGEIAESLGIKQVTVESYISNLKNKCGVNTKGELIEFLAENRILETIIV
jgi:DNA-binding CsgD family transcriptional regulator